mmetsp:Transcript_66025/g.144828  ORF Transcript_66025/g.144828 Transcript_66025/m.144828 type:complete len:214 (+) Transcript_66025:148-789(+)
MLSSPSPQRRNPPGSFRGCPTSTETMGRTASSCDRQVKAALLDGFWKIRLVSRVSLAPLSTLATDHLSAAHLPLPEGCGRSGAAPLFCRIRCPKEMRFPRPSHSRCPLPRCTFMKRGVWGTSTSKFSMWALRMSTWMKYCSHSGRCWSIWRSAQKWCSYFAPMRGQRQCLPCGMCESSWHLSRRKWALSVCWWAEGAPSFWFQVLSWVLRCCV